MDFEQNLSSLHLSFDKLIDNSNTGVLSALLIKYRKQHSAKNTSDNLVHTRNKIQARQFDSANLSALVNIAKYIHTVQIQNEILRRRNHQNKINFISCYSNLPVKH